jgi:hypothetical protein
MSRANASDTSLVCEIFCIVWQPSEPGAPSHWAVSEGDKCLPCPADTVADLPPDIGDFTVEYNETERFYTVTYPKAYALVPSGDPTPDEFIPGFAALRRGESANDCRYVANDPLDDPSNGDGMTRSVVFGTWDAAWGDRIELVLKHCV